MVYAKRYMKKVFCIFLFLVCHLIYGQSAVKPISTEHLLSLHQNYLNLWFSNQGLPLEIQSLELTNSTLNLSIKYNEKISEETLPYFESLIIEKLQVSYPYLNQNNEPLNLNSSFTPIKQEADSETPLIN